jgi:putative FmdB family regulatory protein
MPIYSYHCPIHKEFEVQQSIKDPSLDWCPECTKSDDNKTEYHCKKCDVRWGASNGDFEKTCKTCNLQDNVELEFPKPTKLISLSSFVLKGGCWAKEGYSK